MDRSSQHRTSTKHDIPKKRSGMQKNDHLAEYLKIVTGLMTSHRDQK
jgi:hypothetical protein